MSSISISRRGPRSRLEVWSGLGLAVVLAFFLVSATLAVMNVQTLRGNNDRIRDTHAVIVSLNDLLSKAQDAETGQRGYLLTGDARYLTPYEEAVSAVTAQIDQVGSLTQGNPVQQAHMVQLRQHMQAKLSELAETINLRRTQGEQAALAVVTTDRGKIEMDAVRSQLDLMRQEEVRQRQVRLAEMQAAYRTAIISGVLSGLFGGFLTVVVFLLIRRTARARARQEWLQTGQVGLSEAMMGDKTVEQLADSVLTYLAAYTGFHAGVLFKGEAGVFRRVASLGVIAETSTIERFGLKDGLLGRVASEGRSLSLNDVPEGYLTIGSALGQDKPRHLLIVPALAEGVVNAVIELGFLHHADDRVAELLDHASGAIGIALRSARYRSELQEVLEETQRQAEELQVQSEELRVSNEELEEQGRALKESQTRLEQQQVELEQTNSQLEEQAQTLETQRDDLERASATLTLRARELEQASQYKTDFLANMSHELRTPLNSLLILSKLLGDNPEDNLTADQVRFARTIESSGNDLLTLINDILDLSKIEAGHIQIQPEVLPLSRLVTDLRQTFEPVAKERGLAFEIDISRAADAVETDRQRLTQILKNLLSNAFKFTDQGNVSLNAWSQDGVTTIEVTDTGIGISAEQQEGVFEAFQQADGTISRKYGGTGLGLSISRELARLLGGELKLRSRLGEGSTFSILIPDAYDPGQIMPRTRPEMSVSEREVPAEQPKPALALSARRPASVEDDRNDLQGNRRLLLVIEDDDVFAAIVRDLAREMGFQCLVAGTAEDALRLAKQFQPSAVVLDIGLPDQSGLIVLDSLKRDDATRHIPIHVVSGEDHGQTALSLGAVGALVKPIQREALAEVLRTLEARRSGAARRVLIVEDDDVQRDAVKRLLSSSEVETVGVGTAAECLEQLASQTFDCVVLDLSLPDASGFSILETLSENGDHGFPPVIVYTGRDLSADHEQKLRRYSSSIILKGAKSPERLVDEVSLFLHQVVSDLPAEQQNMIRKARNRDAVLEGRRILIVEDDVRNVYSLTNVLEPRGAKVEIARNGQEALDALHASEGAPDKRIDLVLMDVMMPVMDGLTATREIRADPQWAKLPVLMLTAKAMPDDQERCLAAGANDYMAKPIDVDKLLSLVRVWMPR